MFPGKGWRRLTQVDAGLYIFIKNTYFFSYFIKIEIFYILGFSKIRHWCVNLFLKIPILSHFFNFYRTLVRQPLPLPASTFTPICVNLYPYLRQPFYLFFSTCVNLLSNKILSRIVTQDRYITLVKLVILEIYGRKSIKKVSKAE